eukprot:scaffold18.g1967.t1
MPSVGSCAASGPRLRGSPLLPASAARRAARRRPPPPAAAAQPQQQAGAGAGAGGGLSSALADQERVRALKAELEAAVAAEDFGKAAQLRDELKALVAPDPRERLQRELAEAVADEDFGTAARLRDELAALKPPPRHFDVPPIASAADTEGIEVLCCSKFMPEMYEITLTNKSDRTIKVMERHWRVMNGHARVKEVHGAGVVGKQPVVPPGATFTWRSSTYLPTPQGEGRGSSWMEGTLDVYIRANEGSGDGEGGESEGAWTQSLLVKIERFGLNADA